MTIDESPYRSVLRTFNITEAAEALGRSLPNFRRWVNNEMIPEPVLRETTRRLFCYSGGELQLIAQVLARHEQEFSYFCEKHTQVVEEIAQAIHGYRDINFGEHDDHQNTTAATPAPARRPRSR